MRLTNCFDLVSGNLLNLLARSGGTSTTYRERITGGRRKERRGGEEEKEEELRNLSL